MTDVASAAAAIKEGRLDDAIAALESLADQGVVGSGVAYDRGLAYALRARSGRGMSGDLGRAVHGFEETLRRDPHDGAAQKVLEELRREIAARDAHASGKAEEVGAPPAWRAVVVALPGNAWVALALAASLVLCVGLVMRPRLPRGSRLAASTASIVALLIALTATGLGLAARHLRSTLREAVVVAPHATALPEGGGNPIELDEGARVDVVEERATSTRIRTERGDGWAPRDALRMLPVYRP